MVIENWKDIPDFPDYQVSDLGRVKSLKRGKEKILKPRQTSYGSLCVTLCDKGCYVKTIRDIMARTFVSNPRKTIAPKTWK